MSSETCRTGNLSRIVSVPGVVAGGLLVLLGWINRYLFLDKTGIWLDEAYSLFYSSQSIGWLIEHGAGLINHPPVYFLTLKAWRWLFGSGQVSLESLSVVVSLLAIVLFYALARCSFTHWTAFGLSALFALHPFFLYYSVELRMYALAVAGLTGFALSLQLLLDRTGWIRWSSLTVFSLLCLYSHSLTLLYLLPGMVLLGWRMRSENKFNEYLGFLGAVAVLYLPWFIQVLRQAMRISSDFWIPPFGTADVVRLVYAWGGYTQPHDSGPELLVHATAVGLLFGVPLLFGSKKPWTVETVWYGLTVLFPFCLLASISLTGESVFLLRGFLFGLPFVLLLWGQGLEEFPRRIRTGVLILFVVFLGWNSYRLRNSPPHAFLRDIAARVTGNYPADTVTVHTSKRTFVPFQLHYRPNSSNRLLGDQMRYFFPAHWETTLGHLRGSYRNRPVLFVIYENEYPDWKQLLKRLDGAFLETTRTLKRGEKVFHLLFLSRGFDRGNVDLAALYR